MRAEAMLMRATPSREVVYLTLEAQAKSKPNRKRMAARAYPRNLEAFTRDHLPERIAARTPIKPKTIRRAGIKKPLYIFLT